jgi:hypothetical protein
MNQHTLPDDYEDKAIKAWFRIAEQQGYIPDQPRGGVQVESDDTVSLSNVRGEFARLRWNGRYFVLIDGEN